ncbi:MAG: exodeoxyribonuclease VII small subunit [Alphaproteobacteria bacterium]|nr:exodeoxyribonuclease VII small subunit [Alphaproteobacteria bacterium]
MQEKITFEAAMAELEEIVRKLENGQIPLEDAVKAYEKGMQLKKICETKLNDAQMKIEKLVIKNGKPEKLETFDVANSEE